MLQKILDRYIKNKTLLQEKSMGDQHNMKKSSEPSSEEENLEKKILKIFGIILQLIVFYLPLINVMFRGKVISGIIF